MKKKIYWILSILLVIVVIVLLVLPFAAKKYAIYNSKELIGRQIDIDKLKLNYFTSTVRVIGFAMYETDEEETFLSFDTLLVNLQPLNLVRNELVIEKLHLTGLYSKVIRDDTTFNFDDLIRFHTPAPDTSVSIEDTARSEPFQFRFSDIELRKANLVLDDRNVDKTMRLRDLSFAIPYIAWNQEDRSEAGIRFNFEKEGYFETKLKVDPSKGDFDAEVIINSLYLNAFYEYAALFASIGSLEGKFNADFHITGNTNTIEEAVVGGKVDIMGFEVTDSKDQRLVAMKELNVRLKKMDPFNSRFEVDSVKITGPYARFVLNDSTNNFAELLSGGDIQDVTPEEETPDTEATTTPLIYYSLNALIIDSGVVDYTDNLTGEPFDYNLSNITFEADSITTDAGWYNIYTQMLLNNRGTLTAEVGFNPADPVNNIKLDYVIKDFLLSDLNIYSRFYMGFPIIYGDMYYKSTTEIADGQLTSENKLIMTDVELGDKGDGMHDLPLKFALFLLKDREGIINLEVPVRGDLNDPQVSVGKIVWNTFKNLILKVAAAPFDALAGLVKADPKDLKSIQYDYMDTVFTENRQKQLDMLLDLEKKKEGLGIELIYFNDADKEKEHIRKEKELEDEEKIIALAEAYKSARIQSLLNYLNYASDSTSIKVTESKDIDPGNAGSKPVFRIEYSMAEQP
jgi:hypothetical protein